jgi:hypothetical protein
MLHRVDQRVLPPIGRALGRLSRGARRLRVVMVTASVLSVAIVLLTVYAATRSPSTPERGAARQVRIGVTAGDSIPAYIRTAQAHLHSQVEVQASTGIFALVSFSGYVGPDDVAALVAGAQLVHVFTHVPLTGKTTEIFDFPAHRPPADITNAMYSQARTKAQAASNNTDIAAATPTDTDEGRRLRADLSAAAAIDTAEANAYGALCECVYATVVFATPAQLAIVATRPGVRVVDPAPDVKELQSAIFAPPRPEEAAVADGQDGAPASADDDGITAGQFGR